MKRSLHDKVLIAISCIAGTLGMISVSVIDSGPIPFVVLILCIAWLALFAHANGCTK